MGKNFIQRQQEHDRKVQEASRQTYLQFLTDMVEMALNDPDAMGGHAFGEQKIKHFISCVSKYYDTFITALDVKDPEADYIRVRMEERMQQIFPSGYVPFPQRYDFINDLPEIGGKK